MGEGEGGEDMRLAGARDRRRRRRGRGRSGGNVPRVTIVLSLNAS